MDLFNKNSILYLMYILSLNKELPYMPREIREIIWEKYFSCPFISCIVCNEIILNFNINIFDTINTETIYINNGVIICPPCKYTQNIMF